MVALSKYFLLFFDGQLRLLLRLNQVVAFLNGQEYFKRLAAEKVEIFFLQS